MKFKIDENLPAEVADEVRSLGYASDTVQDERLSGRPDREIVAAARAEGRILFTLDKGIADLVRSPAHMHSGVVLFRPGTVGRRTVIDFVRRRLPAVLLLDLAGKIAVVTNDRIRIR